MPIGSAMRYPLPEEPAKIRQMIRRYERSLAAEKAEIGVYGDGAGKRYLLAPLYLIMGDLEGALDSFEWYDEEFPDDSGDAGHYLCWALALYRGEDEPAARTKLGRAMLRNLYIIPALLDEPIDRLDIWHGSNTAEPGHLDFLPHQFFCIWTPEELAWAKKVYHRESFKTARDRYIEIYTQLKHERPGPTRTQLVMEASDLRENAF